MDRAFIRSAAYLIWRRALVVLTLGLMINACGWQLRGYQQFKNLGDKRIASVDLSSGADNRLFLASLKRQLKDLSIELSDESEIKLNVGSENMERRPLSYSSTGIPVQYQLIMTVTFTVSKNLETLAAEKRILARRQYDFDTELVVAKNEEEKQLLQEMREELAMEIIAELHQ